MNLLRAAGRAMMAGFFIANGVKAIKDPEALVPEAEPIAEKFVPLAQQAFPEAVSAYVPEDTKTLIRINGALAVVGGVAMATGLAPRAGGALAAASMIPHLLASDPRKADDKAAGRSLLIRNLALTGAAIVLTQDTQGHPSLLWRARRHAADKASQKQLDRVTSTPVGAAS
jgi:uncharacterized membrane protein YphA (DoxX/SURF4 family)